jgi:dTDP-4-dehydrorhamnose 3,5-epimerase
VNQAAAVPAVGSLPHGVRLAPLRPHRDERGTFLELFREEWDVGVEPVQWNAVHSEAGVLRGVHVHPRHDDYLTVVSGRATIGLRDLREDSPTEGATACVEIDSERPAAISIPHGVAHGFYFHEPSIHIYAVSHYWDMADELGCRWDDPRLGIPWPQRDAAISERDAELPSLGVLRDRLLAAWSR